MRVPTRKAGVPLEACKGGNGTVQFPLDKRLRTTLITRLAEFRIADNLERAELMER